jgi:TnpA family transposase
MASIERTAYPLLTAHLTPRELDDAFTPTTDEAAWARRRCRTPHHLLALAVLLKVYQKLGYFPGLDEVPNTVIGHVRERLSIRAGIEARIDSPRTAKRLRELVRQRRGTVFDGEQARTIAEKAIRAAAESKDNPADLINVALDELVRERCELPAFSTLDRMAGAIRTEVNTAFFAGIRARMSEQDIESVLGLLSVNPLTGRSMYARLREPAPAPKLTKFREHLKWLAELDRLGEHTGEWLADIPPAKLIHFAGEAAVQDAASLRDFSPDKRLALLACLLHRTRVRARDEVVAMFRRRVAAIHKRGRLELDEIRERHRAETERLWEVFGQLLAGAREALGQDEQDEPSGEPLEENLPGESVAEEQQDETADDAGLDEEEARALHERAGRLMLAPLAEAGGVDQVSTEHAAISAHHGNNYLPLLERYYKSHRPVLLELLARLDLVATSADDSVLTALGFLKANAHLRADFICDALVVPEDGESGPQPAAAQTAEPGLTAEGGAPARLDLSFASEAWRKVVYDKAHPEMVNRRLFEICVFSYLAQELGTGDIAVSGSEDYADYRTQLLAWEQCEPLVAEYCAEAGLPADAAGFVAALKDLLKNTAQAADVGYPANADLVIDQDGTPHLRQRTGADRRPSAILLEKAIEERLPERHILDVLARTGGWLGWWRPFGPLSGSDPKLKDPLERYVQIAFTYGSNLGAAQAARHMRGVSAKELSVIAARHCTAGNLDQARTIVVNAFSKLEITRVWGDGSSVAADGTKHEIWTDNLMAEYHIRYGGYGGIAYHHVSDTYIALFSHFIPCGVWEAVYILEGLLQNRSDIQPTEIHADTQGQSYPVFGLAHLLGFDLLPRIRNWQDLIFYRPGPAAKYEHIDALFGPPGKNTVNWAKIQTHWQDLLQVVLSVRAGKISSATLLRKLGHESKKNKLYQAFSEVGRAVRTIALLRYLTDPELRAKMTAATNKAETFNGYSKWLAFGNNGVIADNDPDQQEKIIKFNELEANCLIYSTALDITEAVRSLKAEGWQVDNDDLATISPYQPHQYRRFGDYLVDTTVPDAPDGYVDLGLPPTLVPAAGAPPRRRRRADPDGVARQMALFSQADPYAVEPDGQ